MPAQLHSTCVSASVPTTVASRLGTSSSAVSASSVLIVLAGGWATSMSRPASTWPVSMSATIHAGAGPSGIGTLPDGWMSGSAEATGAIAVATGPDTAQVGDDRENLPMERAA